MSRQLRHEDYTVGWVCALPIELAAAQEMLDEEHDKLGHNPNDNDENQYTLGSIGGHNVVIVCLPAGRIGNNPATAVATQMRATFKAVRFGLMVGIGGGVPSAEADIRLGDVVVSQPYGAFNGVIQYDMGKSTPRGFERTGSLNSPPQILLGALSQIRANELRGKSRLLEHVSRLERNTRFQRSRAGPDVLFDARYDHEGGQTCDGCSSGRQKIRIPREVGEELGVHYGTIASGNQVMRNAAERDKVCAELGNVLCFEMEAAGLMNSFPCLVVRGICDYSDSHKNKTWQPYAAATAAAYAKEVLLAIPPAEIAKTDTTGKVVTQEHGHGWTPKYYIHFPKNRYFVGRREELDNLKQKLLVDQDCQELSILGLGGTGKTQVALQFAYFVKETQPEWSIFWMSAISMGSFEQACLEIALELGITSQAAGREEDAKELVKQHLSSSRSGRWLLVVDNADDLNIFFGIGQTKGIADYLPQSDKGVVLYTTRTPEVAELTRGDVIEIGAMDQQDAVTFLTKSLTRENLLGNTATANELLEELAYLPLAIAQAAAYLNRNRMPIANYLHLLRNTEKNIVDLMSREFRDNMRYKESANAVATTWVVSFSQIREHDRLAADILEFMSCVEWKAIPRSILPRLQSEVEFEVAIGTLCGYSLLTRRSGDSRYNDSQDPKQKNGGIVEEEWYDMHRLVHLATRIWIDERGDAATVMEKAMRHVADVFPLDEYEDHELWRAYLPHAIRLLSDAHSCSLETKSKLSLSVGICLWFDRRIREAVTWLRESCDWRDRLDEDDPDRLMSQLCLAIVYQADGQVQKAVKLLEHIVAVQEKVLAEDHPSQLASQHELASVYQADGQVQKAVKLLEHIVKVREVLAEDHPSRLVSQHGLATAYEADGQVQKAVKLLEHVVAVEARVLRDDHPSRLASQHALASVYRADRQVQKAVELLEHVVKVREVLAEDHPSRLASQHVLAMAYQADGQVQKAVELLEHVVKMREVLAEDHPSRLASQHVLAMAYQADGQVQKAVKLLEHVVAVKTRVLRDDHPSRVISVEVLEMLYAEL